MASLGDISVYPPSCLPWWDYGSGGSVTPSQSSVALLGSNTIRACANLFTVRKGISVIIPIPGVGIGDVLTISKNAQAVEIAGALSTTCYFYDLEDGTYIATDTRTGATWRVVIVGTTVTVTLLTGGSSSGDCDFVIMAATDFVVMT